MENIKTGKTIQYYARALHRDIGFIVIGLTVIYALSGILLIYRPAGFFQVETTIKKEVASGLEASQLAKALGMHHFEFKEQKGDTIYFNEGSYDRATGVATFTEKKFPAVLNSLAHVHQISSRSQLHYLATVYAILLLFLALSPLFMYKPGSKPFRRCISMTSAGVVVAIILMVICGG